jgi:hypothetical protein
MLACDHGEEAASHAIAATYGHIRRLWYDGPADVENASRRGVHRFTPKPERATTFASWWDAMRASWRASPPAKHDEAFLVFYPAVLALSQYLGSLTSPADTRPV